MHQGYFSRLVAHYGVVLPTGHPSFVESSLETLARFGLHPSEDIHTPARLLLQGVVERMTPLQRRMAVDEWSCRYLGFMPAAVAANTINGGAATALVDKYAHLVPISSPSHVSPGSLSAMLVLSVIAFFAPPSERDAYFSADHWAALTEVLLAVLCMAVPQTSPPSPTSLSSSSSVAAAVAALLQSGVGSVELHPSEAVCVALAADILSRGAKMWSPFVADPLALMRVLFVLTFSVIQPTGPAGAAADSAAAVPSTPVAAQPNPVAQAASRALLEFARLHPKHFVTVMAARALHPKSTEGERSAALLMLVALARKHPSCLVRILPAVIEAIVRCLDPSNAATRRILLGASTQALYTLVNKFPMLAFHQQSQRLALGTDRQQKAVVVIYDLRTGTKWRVLEGHHPQASVSAVAFNEDAERLVSYAADESPLPTLRVWRTGGSNFFAGLLGLTASPSNTYELPPLAAPSLLPAALADSNAQAAAQRQAVDNLLAHVRARWTAANRVVLTREDRSDNEFNVGS